MKRVISVVVCFILLSIAFTACKKKDTKEAEKSTTQQVQVAQTSPSEEKEPVNADENCSKAYDFMKAFVEQMEQQMAKMGKQPPQKKEFPPKEKFVKACKDLPTDIIRCLDMEYSMKHQQECQEAKKNADPEKMKKFEEALK